MQDLLSRDGFVLPHSGTRKQSGLNWKWILLLVFCATDRRLEQLQVMKPEFCPKAWLVLKLSAFWNPFASAFRQSLGKVAAKNF